MRTRSTRIEQQHAVIHFVVVVQEKGKWTRSPPVMAWHCEPVSMDRQGISEMKGNGIQTRARGIDPLNRFDQPVDEIPEHPKDSNNYGTVYEDFKVL
jgi:hypothetical protein